LRSVMTESTIFLKTKKKGKGDEEKRDRPCQFNSLGEGEGKKKEVWAPTLKSKRL